MNLNIDAGKGGKKQKIQVDAPGKKKKSNASLESKKARAGWIFVLPFVLGFFLIYVPIIFDSIKYSFNEIKILVGGKREGWHDYLEEIDQYSTHFYRNVEPPVTIQHARMAARNAPV